MATRYWRGSIWRHFTVTSSCKDGLRIEPRQHRLFSPEASSRICKQKHGTHSVIWELTCHLNRNDSGHCMLQCTLFWLKYHAFCSKVFEKIQWELLLKLLFSLRFFSNCSLPFRYTSMNLTTHENLSKPEYVYAYIHVLWRKW